MHICMAAVSLSIKLKPSNGTDELLHKAMRNLNSIWAMHIMEVKASLSIRLLYRKAADQGHAGAQFYIGIAYIDGEGVYVDNVEGLKWMKLSAKNGYKDAIKYLKSLE